MTKINLIRLSIVFAIFSMIFSVKVQAQKVKTQKEMIELIRNLNVTHSFDDIYMNEKSPDSGTTKVSKDALYVDLPHLHFNNPDIYSAIIDHIKNNKYFQKENSKLYIGLRADSIIVFSDELAYVSVRMLEVQRKHKLEYNYVGVIFYKTNIITVIADKSHPILWATPDYMRLLPVRIYSLGDKLKPYNFSEESVKNILLNGKQDESNEPIDSLTRNEMIHSWFDK